jgi:CheY-like chemotaxis protein
MPSDQGPSFPTRSTARILVVDNDPWIPRVAATILGRLGHLVSVAGDAQGALASALMAPPDAVVSTVALPAVDGKAWWERLRAAPEMSATPVIFLTASPCPPADIRGFAHGVDECLTKPFRIEELERAVRTVLERAREAAARAVSDTVQQPPPVSASRPSFWHRPLSAFRGVVDEIGLSSLLVMLEMERKTGILVIEKDETAARLFLRNGHVIRAEIDEPERLSGAAAVYQALSWNDGLFDFLVGDVGGIDEIQTSTTFLLMEAARRIDEMQEAKGDH